MNYASLLKLAATRRREITVAGHVLVAREPNSLEEREKREKVKEVAAAGGDSVAQLRAGMAYLIEACLETPEGKKAFTPEEADTIAGGRLEVFIPISNALLDWPDITAGDDDPEEPEEGAEPDPDEAPKKSSVNDVASSSV